MGGGSTNNAAAGGVTFNEGELTSVFANQLRQPPMVAAITQQQGGMGLTLPLEYLGGGQQTQPQTMPPPPASQQVGVGVGVGGIGGKQQVPGNVAYSGID